jgi:signal peptidase I
LSEEHSEQQENKMSLMKDFIIPIVIALAVVLLLRTFVVGMYYVPSGSMIPTLEIKDHVVVTKFNYHMHEPERGDIVVFKYPPNERSGEKEIDYVKRLIGLPGETVEIKQNTVFVDGQPLSEPYINSDTAMPDMEPITIGEGEYFVMGDNRNNSSDSRVWGCVPREDLIGKAQVIYWPVSRAGGLYS